MNFNELSNENRVHSGSSSQKIVNVIYAFCCPLLSFIFDIKMLICVYWGICYFVPILTSLAYNNPSK